MDMRMTRIWLGVKTQASKKRSSLMLKRGKKSFINVDLRVHHRKTFNGSN
jgi:hypothetical protein